MHYYEEQMEGHCETRLVRWSGISKYVCGRPADISSTVGDPEVIETSDQCIHEAMVCTISFCL